MALRLPKGFSLAADLRLIGADLLARTEGCGCQACQVLDTKFDADAIAAVEGQPIFVSWRAQPDFSQYRTITIRESNDRGNYDVQAAKIRDGRSIASVYVQSYPTGVAWAFASAVQHRLRPSEYHCPDHPQQRDGSGGQRFWVICPRCSDVHWVPRTSTSA